MREKYDVVIVGGGFAGFAAACAAAREGADTLLVEKNGCLGGAAADSLVTPFMRYCTRGDNVIVNAGLFTEFRRRMGIEGVAFNDEQMKVIMERMCLDYGVKLLYHTTVTGVEQEENRIVGLHAYAAGRRFALRANVFIDATGDGNLAAMAGCGYELGEAGSCQPMTLCFRMCNVDTALFKQENGKLNEYYVADKENGLIRNPREDVLWFYTTVPGVIHFNTTRVINVDPTDPEELTRAEIEARNQVTEMAAFLKRHFKSFENAEVVMTAARTGVRESRLIHGEYTITEQDILEGRQFESAIARGAYGVDIHNPGGSGTVIAKLPDGVYYTIPYESCIAKDKANLLVAGRCISSTHAAQSAYRVMPICCSIGEGVGTAAGICAGKALSDVRQVDVAALREKLIQNGALV